MYNSVFKAGMIAAAAVLLSGCVLFDGSRRTGPDEFGVVSRAPLSQPPDFALRPPRAGEKRPNEVTPREQARSNLLRSANSGAPAQPTPITAAAPAATVPGIAADGLSSGERALLRQADALDVDPNIRLIVDRETGRVKEDESLVDTLVFWRDSGKKADVIDPQREAMRLSRNAAEGAPPTRGASPSNKR